MCWRRSPIPKCEQHTNLSDSTTNVFTTVSLWRKSIFFPAISTLPSSKWVQWWIFVPFFHLHAFFKDLFMFGSSTWTNWGQPLLQLRITSFKFHSYATFSPWMSFLFYPTFHPNFAFSRVNPVSLYERHLWYLRTFLAPEIIVNTTVNVSQSNSEKKYVEKV